MGIKSKVFIGNTTEFDSYEALIKLFNVLGIKFDFKNAVIKLNLCSLKSRETGATSDPIVVEQLVRLLNENNVKVTLVESNSASKNADLAFAFLGFKDLEKKYNVKCVNLSKDEFLVKKVDGYYFKALKIPKTIEAADFFITHPKLKTHSSMKIRLTGALKNQFGCVMDKNKSAYHCSIHEVIADVNQVLAPDMAIMDGIIAMTGYGPTDGIPQRLNLLLASKDLVAIDSLAARIFGYDPRDIRYIKLASNKRIGNIDSEIVGDKIKNVNLDMHINSFIMRSFELLSSIGISAPGE
jgi:uncharacterized protein (DUF362 family)